MKKKIIMVSVVSCFFYAVSLQAILYIWQDEKGYHLTDNLTQVPKEYQVLIGEKPEPKKEANGLGYWRDDKGNFHFYQLSSQKPLIAKPSLNTSHPSQSYNPLQDESWRGKPNPEVWTKTVAKILTPEEILLDSGETLKYSGIAFPEQIKKDHPLYQEALAYQKNLLEGKVIKILFDQKKQDEKGKILGLVFYGKDVFVNADLILKGYAQRKTVPPNLEYMNLYRRLEEQARKNKLGIWKQLEK